MYDESLFALLAIFGMFIFVLAILGIVSYILMSLGLYKLASNQNIENPWIAWIPIANLYILGKLIKDLKISTFDVPSVELALPIGSIVALILGNIPLIGWLITLAYLVLFLFALLKLYRIYRPEQAVLWLVLSIVLPFMGPIFIFMLRNDTPKHSVL